MIFDKGSKRYHDFRHDIIVAALLESRTARVPIDVQSIVYKYILDFEWYWVADIISEIAEDGIFRIVEDAKYPREFAVVEITEEGLKSAENILLQGKNPAISEYWLLDQISKLTDDNQNRFSDEIAVLSRSFSAAEREVLVTNIDRALAQIDKAISDQGKRAQAMAFLRAARSLAEAPEPPYGVIKFLLQNVDRIVGIAGLFVGVASILISL